MKLLVSTTLGRTISAFLTDQIEQLSESHDVAVLCTATDELNERVTACAQVIDAPWSRPMQPLRLPAALRSARSILRVEQPDVVYVHTAIASGIVRLALVGWRRRPTVVYCAHGFDGAAAQPTIRRTAARGVERVLLRWTDVLIVMNDEDEEWARRRSGTEVVRMPSIGLDLELWKRQRPPRTPQAPFRLGIVAELSNRKRVHLAIEAISQLRQHHDIAARLDILGDGALRSDLEDLTAALGLTDLVQFHGFVSDPQLHLEKVDLLLSTSRQEGLARSLLEALALGVPVVGVAARGVTDVLRPAGGVLVTDPDPRALADAIAKILFDPSRHAELISTGRASVEVHDLGVVGPRYVSVIESAQQ